MEIALRVGNTGTRSKIVEAIRIETITIGMDLVVEDVEITTI